MEDVVSYLTVDLVKIVLAAALIGYLLVVRGRAPGTGARPAARGSRGLRTGGLFLAALALLAVANYYHFGFFHTKYTQHGWLDRRAFLHLWDSYHYYVGAKYFDELGYGDLYNATLVADAEDGARLAGVAEVRDLAAGGFLPRARVLERAADIKARFTPRRWGEFTADVRYFTERLPPRALVKVLSDHGYNPTPAWNTTGSALANLVPVRYLPALALLDIALLAAVFGAIGAAFGTPAALVATIFFGVDAFSAFSIIGGSFLRYDWLLALVLCQCLLRRRRYAAAGAALAVAALLRVFPALFLFGLAARALAAGVRLRALPRRYVRFLVSFLGAAAILGGYGCLNARGPEAWREFAGKIASHHRTLSANSVGFTMVFLHDENAEDPISFSDAYGRTTAQVEATYSRVKAAELESRRGAFLLSVLSILALAALAATGVPDDEALAFGALPVFMLLTLSNYYYVFLIVNAVAWYKSSGRRPLPLLLLLLTQIAVLWIGAGVGFPLYATTLASLAFFMFVLALLCTELISNRNHLTRLFRYGR
jgi:hypothetical protein